MINFSWFINLAFPFFLFSVNAILYELLFIAHTVFILISNKFAKSKNINTAKILLVVKIFRSVTSLQ